MKDEAIITALDLAFIALCTIAAEVWMIGIALLLYRVWTKP